MTKQDEVHFYDGSIYRVGERVEVYAGSAGWVAGTIIAIERDRTGTNVKVNPDSIERLGRWDAYPLNPDAAARSGKPDFVRMRDFGVGGGSLRHI